MNMTDADDLAQGSANSGSRPKFNNFVHENCYCQWYL